MYLRAEWSLRLADSPIPLSPKMLSEMEWQICTLGALQTEIFLLYFDSLSVADGFGDVLPDLRVSQIVDDAAVEEPNRCIKEFKTDKFLPFGKASYISLYLAYITSSSGSRPPRWGCLGPCRERRKDYTGKRRKALVLGGVVAPKKRKNWFLLWVLPLRPPPVTLPQRYGTTQHTL